MARLTTQDRKNLPASKFALPGGRFPIPDKAHAIAAKRLAPRSLKAGNITMAQVKQIDAMADRMLGNSDSDLKPKNAKQVALANHFARGRR